MLNFCVYFQIAGLDLGSSPPNRVVNKGAPPTSEYDDPGIVGKRVRSSYGIPLELAQTCHC